MRRLRLKLVLLLSLIPLIGFCQENEGPTMGWSSWNTYRVNISDSLIMRQADAIIRHCLANRGAGGLVIDSETGVPGVHNVYMHDCVFQATDQAFRFKSRRPRGGGGSSITVERVRASVSKEAFYVGMLGSLTGCSGMMFLNCEFSKITIFAKDKIKSIS